MDYVVLVFVMVIVNSLLLSPVIGCNDKSPPKPPISFLSDIVGKGELMETLSKSRNCDPHHNEHTNFMGDVFNDVRECQHGEGCQKQATYGNIDNNIPMFCVKHALRGSVFVKRGYCRCQPASCCL